MPSIKKRICNKCKKIVDYDHNCRDATQDKIYNKTKRVNQEFYSSAAWKRKREYVMKRDGSLCQECLRKGITQVGNIVHHIKELNDYPELALDDENLEVSCQTCHNKEHGSQ